MEKATVRPLDYEAELARIRQEADLALEQLLGGAAFLAELESMTPSREVELARLCAMQPTNGATALVAAGAAFLDVVMPDWVDRIAIERLRVPSLVDCVLGQLYGSFRAGMDTLSLCGASAVTLGFDGPVTATDAEWTEAAAALDAAWGGAVVARKIQLLHFRQKRRS